jgi:hypothetical protein
MNTRHRAPHALLVGSLPDVLVGWPQQRGSRHNPGRVGSTDMLAFVAGRIGGVSAMLTARWYRRGTTRSRRPTSRCWSACITRSLTGKPVRLSLTGAVRCRTSGSLSRRATAGTGSWSPPSARSPWTLCRRPAVVTQHGHGAGSGHHLLWWTRRLTLDPEQPDWLGRSRSVLSNGCASVPWHAALHLTGHDVKTFERRRGQASHDL